MNQSVFLQKIFSDLYGDYSKDDLIAILTDFLGNFQTMKQKLLTSFNCHRLDEFRGELHHNTPSFSYVGLPQITTAFKSLENECKKINDTEEVKNQFKDLVDMLEDGKILIMAQLNYLQYNHHYSHRIAV